MQVYLGGPMFVAAEVRYNLWLAEKLRSHGFEVYCPNESEPINDKTRTNITGEMIYNADREELEASNVYLCQVSEDSGTNWEAGYFDCLSRYVNPQKYWGVIGMATDIRLAAIPNPAQAGWDNQAYYINQFVVGGLKESLGIVRDEGELIDRLEAIRAEREATG